ncbi:MAG: phage tail sheath subtilisin-like domain-containing protein [Ignavibacteriales bacterium]|nr:phage tail sheath subtilisin-like domain-containing protein [Ignavibacteriales bacterium]
MSKYTSPGVYIEEIKGQVRTITGVATSIAVFVGWSNKGPTDRAALILNWLDFERLYGGLNTQSYLGYAVQQFFNNGGTTAYVLRLADKTSAAPASVANTTLKAGVSNVLQVHANNEGSWGRSISITTKKRVPPDSSRFDLKVSYTDPGGRITAETYENLSMDPADARFVQPVINIDSSFINVTVVTGATAPILPDEVTGVVLSNDGADGNILAPNDGNFEQALASALSLLDSVDLINLIAVPGETSAATIAALEAYSKKRRAIVLVDADSTDTVTKLQSGSNGAIVTPNGENAAFFFPWLTAPDPLDGSQSHIYPPSGFVAGLIARIDASRGVWKAPAGTDAVITGVTDVAVKFTDGQNGVLTKNGINCIRSFPIHGIVNWGARTLAGADNRGSEWKYLPVRRMALFLEESLYRGTKWAVFEPNDEPLWAQIRLNVTAFMMSLFRQGAFQGRTTRDAYFVKCDKETISQDDFNKGIVNVLVGFAPLKPAEFIVIKISQLAGPVV